MNSSIIICAYNEEKTISEVVKSASMFVPDSEIIVVDDGSTDNTEILMQEMLAKHHFRYEKLEENKGKSWAMVRGVEIASNEIIVFFDADVSNIKKEHFENLLKPIIEKKADMVLGQPSETLIDYRMNPFRSLTGERAMLKKDINPILSDIRELRFGVETFINLYYQAQGKSIKYTLMDGLKHPTKYEKTSSINATKEFIFEGKEIAVTLMNNYGLILQRVGLTIKKANASTMGKINTMQNELNNTLQNLKDQILN